MTKPHMEKIAADTVILKEGFSAHEMYKIISGKAAMYLHYQQDNEYLVGILSEQTCFGEICVLTDEPGMYTVVAITDVLLMRISHDDFYDFIKSNPKNAVDIMKNMASNLTIMNFNISLLMTELKNSQNMETGRIKKIERKMMEYERTTIENSPYYSMFTKQG